MTDNGQWKIEIASAPDNGVSPYAADCCINCGKPLSMGEGNECSSCVNSQIELENLSVDSSMAFLPGGGSRLLNKWKYKTYNCKYCAGQKDHSLMTHNMSVGGHQDASSNKPASCLLCGWGGYNTTKGLCSPCYETQKDATPTIWLYKSGYCYYCKMGTPHSWEHHYLDIWPYMYMKDKDSDTQQEAVVSTVRPFGYSDHVKLKKREALSDQKKKGHNWGGNIHSPLVAKLLTTEHTVSPKVKYSTAGTPSYNQTMDDHIKKMKEYYYDQVKYYEWLPTNVMNGDTITFTNTTTTTNE